MEPILLKYIFEVHYANGDVYRQNQEDISVGEDKTKSCWTDILSNKEPIRAFFLFNNEDTYCVNLEDGHFEVNGKPFFLHAEEHLTDFSIVYFRNVKIQQEFGSTLDGSGQTVADITKPIGAPIRITSFNFGWEKVVKVNGKDVTERRVMQIF